MQEIFPEVAVKCQNIPGLPDSAKKTQVETFINKNTEIGFLFFSRHAIHVCNVCLLEYFFQWHYICLFRVCVVRRCLSSWHGSASVRKAKEGVDDKLAAVGACRRALKAWVHCSLVQPNVLTKAVMKLVEEQRMKYSMLCWSNVMKIRTKENERDDALERSAHSVRRVSTKRSKQHSWSAWLESRNFLEKEIKVMKLTKTCSMRTLFYKWMKSMNVRRIRDTVKDIHRLRSGKNVLMAWKRKVSWQLNAFFICGWWRRYLKFELRSADNMTRRVMLWYNITQKCITSPYALPCHRWRVDVYWGKSSGIIPEFKIFGCGRYQCVCYFIIVTHTHTHSHTLHLNKLAYAVIYHIYDIKVKYLIALFTAIYSIRRPRHFDYYVQLYARGVK